MQQCRAARTGRADGAASSTEPPSYRLGSKVRYRTEKARSWLDAETAVAS